MYGRKIYYISNPRIDYVDDKMLFYYHDVERESLNQAPEAISERQEVYFKLNTGHEILKAFGDIELENRQKIEHIHKR